LSNHLPWTSAF